MRSIKGFIATALIAATAFAAAGCSSRETIVDPPTPTPEPEPEMKTVKVGVCIYKFDDNFMTLYRQEIEKYFAGQNGDNITYEVEIVDGKNDQSVQTKQINDFIKSGVDVLIINLVQTSSAETVIGIVKDADVPTVLINREPEGGEMDMWDKICYAAAALAQYGDQIDVIFCNNDGMALGALEAIEAAGRTVGEDIYLVGVDALDEVVELVKEGRFTGTILNDHAGQARAAVDAAILAAAGEPFDKYYIVDYVKIVGD